MEWKGPPERTGCSPGRLQNISSDADDVCATVRLSAKVQTNISEDELVSQSGIWERAPSSQTCVFHYPPVRFAEEEQPFFRREKEDDVLS